MQEGFEHAALEKDIADLTEAAKERSGGAVTKETLRETITERVYGPAPEVKSGVRGTSTPKSATGAVDQGPLPAYAADVPQETKLRVEELLDLALHKGLSAAIKRVRKDTPLAMDLFHDSITERLYGEFKRRGILK